MQILTKFLPCAMIRFSVEWMILTTWLKTFQGFWNLPFWSGVIEVKIRPKSHTFTEGRVCPPTKTASETVKRSIVATESLLNMNLLVIIVIFTHLFIIFPEFVFQNFQKNTLLNLNTLYLYVQLDYFGVDVLNQLFCCLIRLLVDTVVTQKP